MNFLFSLLRLGNDLRTCLPTEINEATRQDKNSEILSEITVDVLDYFRRIFRLTIVLAGFGIFPLLIFAVIPGDIASNKISSITYTLWLVALSAIATYAAWPIFSITDSLKKLPPEIYSELVRPLILNLDILSVTINAGLLLYIIPRSGLSTTLPIVATFSLLWIGLPWLAYSRNAALLLKIRIGQIIPLAFLAILTVASPSSVRVLRWSARHQVADKMRVVEQKEITSSWESLQWFTQEGEPNVWFSGNRKDGYRLYSAPGYDPHTNEEIRPVTDQATKENIVAYLTAQKIQQENQSAIENEKRLAEETKRKEDLDLDARKHLIHKYVYPRFEGGIDKHTPALVALDASSMEDLEYEERLSDVFQKAGLRTVRSVFTPSFISSSSFRNLLSGRMPEEASFHPERFASNILIVEKTMTRIKEAASQTEDLISVDVTIIVKLMSSADGRIESTSRITERGIGFKESTAIKNASEKIDEKLKALVPKLSDKL